MRRRYLHLCNEHIRERLPISFAFTIIVEPVSGCQEAHPEFEHILEQAAKELEGRIHA